MSSGGVEDGVNFGQAVVGAGWLGLGGDADGGLGGGKYGGGGDEWDVDGDGLNWWGVYFSKYYLRDRA